MAGILSSEAAPVDARIAAGVAIKNALVAREEGRRQQMHAAYLQIDPGTRAAIKKAILGALGDAKERVGSTAAQVIAALGMIEVPGGGWPELIPALLANVTGPGMTAQLCKASLEAIGFLCEEIDPEPLSQSSNEILTAVVTGLKSTTSREVRRAAASSLLLSLAFARENFEREHERTFILHVVCEAASQTDDLVLQEKAFECLNRILQLYYPLMQSYLAQGIGQLAVTALSSPAEGVRLQAIEFWSTLCEVEMELGEDSYGFALTALPIALPALLQCLLWSSTGDEDGDALEEWTPAMAASTCLGLMAECCRDEIVTGRSNQVLVRFVEQNIDHPEWRRREAAIMAFGSVIDGPSPTVMAPLAVQALEPLLRLARDPVVAIQDSACWAIGKTVDFFPQFLDPRVLERILEVLVGGLDAAPRVAVNCCWSLMTVFLQYGEDQQEEEPAALGVEYTQVLLPYCKPVVEALYRTAERPDALEASLRMAAYQSMAGILERMPREALEIVLGVEQVLQARLAAAIKDTGHLCNLLQSALGRTRQVRPEHLRLVIGLLGAVGSQTTDLEDILLLAGTVLSELNDETVVAAGASELVPHLLDALRLTSDETGLVIVAAGVVGDLARALGHQYLQSYAGDLLGQLLQGLCSPNLDSRAKPHLLGAIADLVGALGGPAFQPFLPTTMGLLVQASQTILASLRPEEEEADLIQEMVQSLLEVFSAILQEEPGSELISNEQLGQILLLIRSAITVARRESQVRSALGLLGDVADSFGTRLLEQPDLRNLLRQDNWVLVVLNDPLGTGSSTSSLHTSNPGLYKALLWAQSKMSPLIS